MKTIKYLTFLLFASLIFVSCDKTSEKRFSVSLIQNFNIDLNDDNVHTFSEEAILSSLEHEELEAVQAAILRYEIVAVKYKVWEYAGPEASTFQGELKIGAAGNPADVTTLVLEEASLTELNSETNHRVWDLSDAEQNKIKEYFLNGNEVSVYGSGNISEVPAHFVLQLVMDIDAIAEIEGN